MRRFALSLGAVASLLAWNSASATEPGTELTIRVIDDHGYAIPTASVRFPEEGDRHAVNHETGAWSGSVLYLPRGREIAFEPGTQVRFQVNAPGYASEWGSYTVQRWRNRLVVRLDSMGRAEKCDSRPQSARCRRFASSHTPSVPASTPPEDFELTPEVLFRLGELREPDPELTAAFSAHLLALGPDYATEAESWADLAMDEAAVLSGDDYVAVVDGLYEVRAKAANVQWQTRRYDWISSDLDWSVLNASERARTRAASIAEEWAEWAEASGEDAHTAQLLCLSAGDAPDRCR